MTSPTLLDSRLHPVLNRCSPPLEVTQEAGEMVFVPSGWHHQVHNLVRWALPTSHVMAQTGQGEMPQGSNGLTLTPIQLCPLACLASILLNTS